jgi:hypothetical protein
MKFNIGEKVRVKSHKWYVEMYHNNILKSKEKYIGQVVTIARITDWGYTIVEDEGGNDWMECEFDLYEFDLSVILAYAKGTILWSPVFGYVELVDVHKDTIGLRVVNKQTIIEIDKSGRWRDNIPGECILWPSEKCRDWSEFVIPNKPWKAKRHDFYYYVDSDGDIKHDIEQGKKLEFTRWRVHNYFPTIDEARKSDIYKGFHVNAPNDEDLIIKYQTSMESHPGCFDDLLFGSDDDEK